jgi:hypothetical protein
MPDGIVDATAPARNRTAAKDPRIRAIWWSNRRRSGADERPEDIDQRREDGEAREVEHREPGEAGETAGP